MAEYRLKIKIGEHEFEADGPVDAVKAQFEAFKDLIAGIPSGNAAVAQASKTVAQLNVPQFNIVNADNIFRADGRVISLVVPPNSDTEAVLLILFGQKYLRKNDSPTGSEIMDGMVQSGYRTTRIDRILASLSSEGAVIITGAHRGKRYRLTNSGYTKAEEIVKEALLKLPGNIL
jgi:hypothetical protein